MFHIVFIESEVEAWKPFQKIPFSDVCQLTYEYEMRNRENGEVANTEFYLVDDDGNEIYAGTLAIGSGFADHIYDHILKKLSDSELNEEEERQKNDLLYSLRQEVPDLHKGLDQSHFFSSAKKEQKEKVISPKGSKGSLLKVIGIVVGVFLTFGAIFLIVFNFNGHSNAQPSPTDETLLQALRYASIQQYDQASKEFDKLNYEDLGKQDKKSMLFSYLLAGNVQKAIDHELSFAESAISYFVAIDNLEKISSVESDSPAIQFEQAYLKKDYEKVTTFYEEISLDGRREEMIVNSFISMKKLDEALSFAESVGNTGLQEKVAALITKNKKRI
jgi:hypothetical protein